LFFFFISLDIKKIKKIYTNLSFPVYNKKPTTGGVEVRPVS
jgi:hypothetical protein